MPKSALPPGFKDQAAGTNTDWNNSIQKYWRKSWFAYGPRATEWWAKWRELPITVLALFGAGENRWESSGGEFALRAVSRPIFFFKPSFVYLSAIQYWCRWSFQIQWPFFVAFHFYFDKYQDPRTSDGKMIYIRFGARRDADKVYWFPSFFIGMSWN